MNTRGSGVLISALLIAGCVVFPFGRCAAAITGYWEEQDSGVTTELFGICFVREDEGWVVGAEGVILHTTDGGETWIRQESGTLTYLYSVAFATPEEGWVVGLDALLHTTDGGETWTDLITRDWKFRGRFYDIALVDPLNGWLGAREGYVLPLRDGVLSDDWRWLGTDISDVDFLDTDMGWCTGGRLGGEEGLVHRTTNGGVDWTRARFDLPVRAIHFTDAEEGWAVGDRGTIFHSLDSGAFWERQESGTEYTNLKDVFFVDDQEGWVVGGSGLILKTFNGGKAWSRTIWNHPLPVPGQPEEYEDFHPTLNRMVFVDPLEGWIVGERGIILHFVGEYETITAFSETTDGDPTLRVQRGSIVLGKGGHPWETSGTRSDLEIEDDVLHPARLNPQENLIKRIRSVEGKIWSTLPASFGTPVQSVIDEDPELGTSYEVPGLSSDATIYLDFTQLYPFHLVVITMASRHSPTGPLLSQRVTVGTNDGDPKDLDPKGTPFLHPVWDEVVGGQPGYIRLWIEFPPQFARYIGVRISESPFIRIFDVKAFADGYVSGSTFLSKAMDFGAPSVWGKLRWEGEQPFGTKVILRTRTGDDHDPNVYWRRIGESERYTNQTESGEPMTRYDYEALPEYRRGEITFDSHHWTRWSAPYPFEQGEALIQSPDARRYLQIQVEFHNAVDAAGTLSSLSVEASNPTSAYVILGEIVPSHAEPARVTTFTYGIRPRFKKGDIGFDTVEIRTPVRPSAIRSVLIDSTEVAFTSQIRDDPSGLVVCFPEVKPPKDNAVVEISFDCAVFRYGSGFPGYILNSRYEEGLPQRVVAGDALEGIGEDVLTVQTKLETPLLLQSGADPNPFTPNGDGIHDETDLSYTILKLFAPAPVRVEVYDLAGRLVRRVYEGWEGAGVHMHRWDGRDDAGWIVSPGMYVYRIELDADADRQVVVGMVHVVF